MSVYCDLYVRLDRGNYEALLGRLAEEGYRCVGFPVAGLPGEVVEEIERCAEGLGLTPVRRSVVRRPPRRCRRGYVYAVRLTDLRPQDVNLAMKTRPLILISGFGEGEVQMLKRAVRYRGLLFEVHLVDLLRHVYSSYAGGGRVTDALPLLGRLVEESRLVLASGASEPGQVVAPKEACAALLGLISADSYTEAFISTVPAKVVVDSL